MNYSIVSRAVIAAGAIFAGLPAQQAAAQSGWTEPQPLNSYAHSDQRLLNESAPRVESDGKGNWLAMWAHPNNTDLAFSSSQDAGASWGPDSQLRAPSPEFTSTHIYAGNNTWLAAWLQSSQIHITQSTDLGTSWSQPVQLPLNNGREIELAADGAGNVLGVISVWTGATTRTMHLIRSADFGHSWSAPEQFLYPTGVPKNASQARIAYAGDNKWLLVSTLETGATQFSGPYIHEYYSSTSTNLGHDWTIAHNIFQDYSNRVYATYDMKVHEDTVVVAFYNDRYSDPIGTDGYGVIVSTNDGATFSTPVWLERPVVFDSPSLSLAVNSSGNWALATDNYRRNTPPVIYMASNPATSWTKFEVSNGTNQEIDIAGGEAGDFVAVVRHIDTTKPVLYNDADIASLRTINSGDDWSSPVLVNDFATTDSTSIRDSQVDLEAGSSAMLSAWIATVTTYQGPSATMFSQSETKGFYWEPASELAKVSTAAPRLVHVNDMNWITYWPTAGTTLGSIAYSYNDGETWSAPVAFDSTVIGSNKNGTLIRVRPGGFISRSFDGGFTWESQTQAPNIGTRQILHTGGQKWLAVGSSPTVLLTSSDNGATWSPQAAPPLPIQGAAASNTGVVVATAFTYEDGPNANERVAKTHVSRSADGGITWSPLVLVHTQVRTETGVVVEYKGYPQPLWLGGDQWAIFPKNVFWGRHQPLDRNYVWFVDVFYIQSDDNALTWSSPEPVIAKSGFDLPTHTDYAVMNNVVTVAFEVSELPDYYEDDLLYTNKLIRGTAAAHDWSLFD